VNPNAPVKMHLCGYCGLGAVHTLPGKCPNCGAALTMKVKERLTGAEFAKVKRDAKAEAS